MMDALTEGTRGDVLAEVKKLKTGQIQALGLVGPPGVGKTTVLKHVCTSEGVGAFHFFKHDDTAKAGLRECLVSITEQLASSVPGMDAEKVLENYGDLKTLFRTALCAPMLKAERSGDVLVVLDALDECTEREEMLEIVSRLWLREMPSWVKLLVSCRPGLDLGSLIVHTMTYTSSYNDVRVFLEQEMKGMLRPLREIEMTIDDDDDESVHGCEPDCDEDHNVRSDEDEVDDDDQDEDRSVFAQKREEEEAIRLVAVKAAGLFVFARDFVQHLRDQAPFNLLDLCDFMVAKGDKVCDGTFKSYFDRLLHQGFKGDYGLYETLVSALAVLRVPMAIEFVEQLLEGDDWKVIKEHAAQLFIFDKYNRVSLPHKTMAAFVLSRERAGNSLYVSSKVGHKNLVRILTQNQTTWVAQEHLAFHLCHAREWEMLREMLLDCDWWGQLLCEEGAAQHVINDLDELYNYKEHADPHVTEVVRVVEAHCNYLRSSPKVLGQLLFQTLRSRDNPILDTIRHSELGSSFLPTSSLHPSEVFRKSFPFLARDPFAMDGDYLAIRELTFEQSSFVSLVNIWSGRVVQRLKFSGRIRCLAISGNMLIGAVNSIALLRDVRTGACLHELEGHSGTLHNVAISGYTAVSACDLFVKVWDTRTGVCLYQDRVNTTTLIAVKGNTVVWAEDADFKLWHRQSGLLEVFDAESRPCDIAMESGRRLVIGTRYSGAIVVGLEFSKCREKYISMRAAKLTSYDDFERTEKVGLGDGMVVASRGGVINIWSYETKTLLFTFNTVESSFRKLVFDGQKLLVNYDHGMRLYAGEECWQIARTQASVLRRIEMRMTTDGKLALTKAKAPQSDDTSSYEYHVHVYDAQDWSILHEIKLLPSDRILRIEIDSNDLGVLLLRRLEDENLFVQVHSLRENELLHEFSLDISEPDFLDGVLVIGHGLLGCAHARHGERWWDIKTGACRSVLWEPKPGRKSSRFSSSRLMRRAFRKADAEEERARVVALAVGADYTASSLSDGSLSMRHRVDERAVVEIKGAEDHSPFFSLSIDSHVLAAISKEKVSLLNCSDGSLLREWKPAYFNLDGVAHFAIQGGLLCYVQNKFGGCLSTWDWETQNAPEQHIIDFNQPSLKIISMAVISYMDGGCLVTSPVLLFENEEKPVIFKRKELTHLAFH